MTDATAGTRPDWRRRAGPMLAADGVPLEARACAPSAAGAEAPGAAADRAAARLHPHQLLHADR